MLFALIDCNNFYVSCERVFNPRIEGKPVIVMSNNDGCAVARSNEAKALGIAMGTPVFKMRELIERHGVVCLSSNYALYGDMSRRVMNVLRDFAPQMEVYSIDEAFLCLDGFSGHLIDYAQRIRATIRKWTGIPVSVGIAQTKTLAKAANKLAKKNGGAFTLADKAGIETHLVDFPVLDVWGVGGQLSKHYARMGIVSALQLRNADVSLIQKRHSVTAARTVLELRGESCIALEEHQPDRKNICVSRGFCRPVFALAELHEALSAYVSRAAEKARIQKLCASALTVFVETNRFKNTRQYSKAASVGLPVATSNTSELLQYAGKLLSEMFVEGIAYNKVGILLNDLSPEAVVQQNMLDDLDRARADRLTKAIDSVNRDWGDATLHVASTGFHRAWATKFAQRTPRYTSRWNELVEAKS